MAVWTEREQALIDGAHEISKILKCTPQQKWNATPELSRHFFKMAAQKGLTGIEVPIEWGGSSASFQCKTLIAEILAEADFGFAMSVINTHNVISNIVHWKDLKADGVLARLVADLLSSEKIACTALTEPHAGSDFSSISTMATVDGSGWRLEGEKSWIINASVADVILVYVQTQSGAGASGIAAFLVEADRPGFIRNEQFGSQATSSLGTSSFKLDGYLAHAEDLIHPAGTAFKRALHSINGARTYVAAMCCGMVSECLSVAAQYGAKRQAFGVMLHDHQGWRWRLADAAIDLDAAKLMVQAAALAIDQDQKVVDQAAKAKVFATRMAVKHIAELLHAMGANGLSDIYPFVRHLSAAQIATLTDGSTEMLLERISQSQRQRH